MCLCHCGDSECGAVPSAQVVAVLMTHACWLFSAQLNNIISGQSGGPAQGPEDQNRRDAGYLQSLFFMLIFTNRNRCTEQLRFKGGKCGWFLSLFLFFFLPQKHVWFRHVFKSDIQLWNKKNKKKEQTGFLSEGERVLSELKHIKLFHIKLGWNWAPSFEVKSDHFFFPAQMENLLTDHFTCSDIVGEFFDLKSDISNQSKAACSKACII